MTPRSQPARVGRQALHRLLATDPRREPLFPTTLLDLQASTGEMVDVGWLLSAWSARTATPPGIGRAGRTPRLDRVDYPWPLSIDGDGPRPAYVGANESWRAWRPAEEPIRAADPARFLARLIEPLVITESAEFLESLIALNGPTRATAEDLLVLSLPAIRRSLAAGAAHRHAWADTFGLWAVTRHPRLLRRIHPFALAIADSYAASALIDGGHRASAPLPRSRIVPSPQSAPSSPAASSRSACDPSSWQR